MIRRVGSGLLVAAAFASPLDSLRAGPLGGLADLLFLLAAGLLALRYLSAGRRVRVDPYLRVMLAAGLFAVAGLIGTLFSSSTVASLANVVRFSTTTIGLPLAVAALMPTRVEVRQLAWAYVLGCTLSSVMSFTAVNPATGRASGLASRPNVLGLSAAFAVLLAYGLWEHASPRGRQLAISCGFLLLTGVTRSGSRAAILALLAGLVVYSLVTQRLRALGYGLGAAGVLVVALVTGLYTPAESSTLDRVLHSSASTEESDAARGELVSTVLDRVDDNVITGSGFATATQAHNVYVQVLDVGGLLGVLAFVALATSILRAGLLGRRDRIVAGSLAAYAGYLVAGVAANTLWDRWLWFPIVIGMAARVASPATVASQEVTPRTEEPSEDPAGFLTAQGDDPVPADHDDGRAEPVAAPTPLSLADHDEFHSLLRRRLLRRFF